MLVVKLQVWPGGNEDLAQDAGTILITNVGGSRDVGEYDVRLFKSARFSKRTGETWRRVRVTDFLRKKLGPYDLLLRALVAACGDRSATAVRSLGQRGLGDEPSEAL